MNEDGSAELIIMYQAELSRYLFGWVDRYAGVKVDGVEIDKIRKKLMSQDIPHYSEIPPKSGFSKLSSGTAALLYMLVLSRGAVYGKEFGIFLDENNEPVVWLTSSPAVIAGCESLNRILTGMAAHKRCMAQLESRVYRLRLPPSMPVHNKSLQAIEIDELWHREISEARKTPMFVLGEGFKHTDLQGKLRMVDVSGVTYLSDFLEQQDKLEGELVKPNQDDDAYNTAFRMLKEGKIDDALIILQKLLQANPKDITILTSIGTARLLQHEYKQAETSLRKALELDHSNIAILYHLGVALSELGKGDEAIKHLQKASEIEPSYVKPWEMLGLIYLKKKDFVAAERCFRRVTILEPASLKGWNNLAVTLKEAGHLTEMEASLREFLKIDPTHVEAPSRYMMLSYILNAKGRTNEAIEVLKQGVHHFPEDGVLWWFLGYFNVNLDRMDEAKAAMKKAIEVQPELLEMMKQHGMVKSLYNEEMQ